MLNHFSPSFKYSSLNLFLWTVVINPVSCWRDSVDKQLESFSSCKTGLLFWFPFNVGSVNQLKLVKWSFSFFQWLFIVSACSVCLTDISFLVLLDNTASYSQNEMKITQVLIIGNVIFQVIQSIGKPTRNHRLGSVKDYMIFPMNRYCQNSFEEDFEFLLMFFKTLE